MRGHARSAFRADGQRDPERGRRAGIAVAVAPLITDLPIILLTVLVVTGISRSGILLALISIAGGAFVGKIGIGTIRSTMTDKQVQDAGPKAETTNAEAAQPASRSSAEGFRNAIIANFLNPGPWIYWLTVGSPLIVGAWKRSPLFACGYLAVFYAFLSGSMIVLVFVAARGRSLISGKGSRWVMRALGAMLVCFAVWFLYGGVARLVGEIRL